MFKIVKIENGQVYIASNSGQFIVVRIEELNFVPQLGDIVEVYQNGNDYLVIKSSNNFANSSINSRAPKVSNSNTSVKSKKTAALLALLGGSIGLHDLYLGQYSKVIYRNLPIILYCVYIINIGSDNDGYYYKDILFPIVILCFCAIWGVIESILIFSSKPGSYWSKDAYRRELR